MLSTLDIPLGTTKDDGKNKMALYKLYNDSIDYRCTKYTCKPKSHRWTFVAWCYTLDMIRNNAQTIFSMNNGRNPLKTDSLSFGLDVVDALVKPFIESRSLCGLQSKIIQKMELVLEKRMKIIENERTYPYPSKSENKSRCHMCINECNGEEHKKRNQCCAESSRAVCRVERTLVQVT